MTFNQSAKANNGYEAPTCSMLVFSANELFLQGSASTTISDWTEEPGALNF